MKRLEITCPEKVEELRYRGQGWPGLFKVRLDGQEKVTKEMSYEESWGFTQKYRPYRCYLCPDGTREFADISCGDAWYRKPEDGEPGYSLVLARTENGRKIVKGAIEAGYISLERVSAEVLEKSQKNLLEKSHLGSIPCDEGILDSRFSATGVSFP